jgi:hypothetical protein
MRQKEAFQKLNYEEKRLKVLAFLKSITSNNVAITWTIEIIERRKDISEKFLEDTYYDLLDFADLVHKNNQEKFTGKMESMSKNLQDMVLQEQAEKNHADDILNQL